MSNDVAETTERGPVITITVDRTVSGQRVARSRVMFAEKWASQTPDVQAQILADAVHDLCAETQEDVDGVRAAPQTK